MTDRLRTIEGLALAAALIAVFDGVHSFGGQFVQNSHDASTKGMHGSRPVYKNNGSPIEADPWRHGKEGRTCTASSYGRRSVTRHCLSYSAVQLASAIAVTRTIDYRVPTAALVTGAARSTRSPTESWTGAHRCCGLPKRRARPATSSTRRSCASRAGARSQPDAS
ncbi:hypothetical protein OG471_00925 [Streptomyces sp. NBC_01336]|uniref:hypothetical protein n=1 Tax=Streptomyces sp. NBC_01336 TaxID=2903829 RepID=UPI002E0FA07D|nr:hypothetical protein OG471_00925 [Streptomyces sp. NBC_01336]